MTFEDLKALLWIRSACVPDFRYPPALWRLDHAGRLMYWFAHGDRSHQHGWEVGHIQARADGGSDHPSNLQAEHYQTNLLKEDARRFLATLKMQQLVNPFLQPPKPKPSSPQFGQLLPSRNPFMKSPFGL